MPYRSVRELPQAQIKRYSPKARRVFLRVLNKALYSGRDESSAFRLAHGAARRVDRAGKARKKLRRKK